MSDKTNYEVIIIGGSYAGLSAAMALGRSLRNVLIIDSGKPCNRQTPHSHNFLTQDGKPPHEIARLAKKQVGRYETLKFFNGLATMGTQTKEGFDIETDSGETFKTKRLIFATGIKDIMPEIKGFSECWGISVIHCPYCHGYEVRNEKTGILGNGEYGFEFSKLISNWTKDLTLFTNGKSALTPEQLGKIMQNNIHIVEKEVEKIQHSNGYIQQLIFKDGTASPLTALYARTSFEQHCKIPETLGCELTDEGYLLTDTFQKTSVPGIFACGDNTGFMRSVANAVAMGTVAGSALNKELIEEAF